MNYYERVQNAVDYIEHRLLEPIEITKAAEEACMSLSNFYRMFYSLSGYTVKEYIRRRRLSAAAEKLKSSDDRVLDIALDCCFGTHESFTRAFKAVTGYTPEGYRKGNKHFCFRGINIMDKYMALQDGDLLEKYPDIKVLKELASMNVAYARAFSTTPESDSFRIVRNWAREAGLDPEKMGLRYFGFDIPCPPLPFSEKRVRGYEVWLTVPDEFMQKSGTPPAGQKLDPRVRFKTVPGGLYAVMPTRVSEVMKAWKRFAAWVNDSRYTQGGHQWLEEHLTYSEEEPEKIKLDLYFPLVPKDDPFSPEKILLPAVSMAVYRFTGKNAFVKAFEWYNTWAMEHLERIDADEWRVFLVNNHESEPGRPDYWHEWWIARTDGTSFSVGADADRTVDFPGGTYLAAGTASPDIGRRWKTLHEYADTHGVEKACGQWFMEFYQHSSNDGRRLEMTLLLPVKA